MQEFKNEVLLRSSFKSKDEKWTKERKITENVIAR